MININGKKWDELEIGDIESLLEKDDDETFFFEYKNDDVSTKKIVEEISAFANTYGGYVLIGIDNDKKISGCTKWDEQRIHTTIHDSLTPIPSFDVRKFKDTDERIIFVIKVDEGVDPPYITNTGKIYERISSGSFPINDSSKLTQLYYKRRDQLKNIENKIEINEIKEASELPVNLCAYLDLGFSVTINDLPEFQKRIANVDLEKISKKMKEKYGVYGITRVGYSIIMTIGKLEPTRNGKQVLLASGVNNFMEVMPDGSVRCRLILCADENNKVDVSGLFFMRDFGKLYEEIVGKEFYSEFVNAYKYEKLVVLKQFEPFYNMDNDEMRKYLENHKEKYGNNFIITNNRIPKNDYICIDKKYFSDFKLEFNNENLISELFYTAQIPLGFIDDFTAEA